MAVSFVGYGSAVGTSLTIPTHQANDLIIIHASSPATAITAPAGWSTITSATTSGLAVRVGAIYAVNNSTTSGTWTNATVLQCVVYRSTLNGFVGIGSHTANNSAGSTNVTYAVPELRFMTSTWICLLGQAESDLATMNSAISGFTSRGTVSDSVSVMAAGAYDTNGNVTSYTPRTGALGLSINNRGVTLELSEYALSGGSGGVPLIGAGGLVY